MGDSGRRMVLLSGLGSERCRTILRSPQGGTAAACTQRGAAPVWMGRRPVPHQPASGAVPHQPAAALSGAAAACTLTCKLEFQRCLLNQNCEANR